MTAPTPDTPPAVPPTWSVTNETVLAAAWPAAVLSPAARIRALAAGLPGVAVEERIVDAPFERVWGFVGDLERSVPTFDTSVARLRIVHRDGTRLRARATSSWRRGGLPLMFDVDLEEGWCWMVARRQLYVVGMAAEPLPDDPARTRYLHLEGLPRRGTLLDPFLRASTWVHRHHIASDVDGIVRAVSADRP